MTKPDPFDIHDVHISDKCGKCEKEGSVVPHTCPYAEELGDDYETLCDCCSECTADCAMDI